MMNTPLHTKSLQLLLLVSFLVLLLPGETFSHSPARDTKQAPNFIYVEPQNIKKFISNLNDLGKLGYKLKAVERYTKFDPPEDFRKLKIAGIVERNEGNTYEYTWFNTLTLPDFIAKIDAPAKEGFYFSQLVHYSLFVPENTSLDSGSIESSLETIRRGVSQDPEDGSIFILERKNDFRDPTELSIAAPRSTRKSLLGGSVINKKESAETLDQAIADIDTRSYQPVAAFFSSAQFETRISHLQTVLFQNTWEYNHRKVCPNYKIVRASQFETSFVRLMSLASSVGYEIVVLGRLCAVVLETGTRVSYQWLKPSEKKFEQNLINLSNAGARFKINGIDGFMQNILVFEQMPRKPEKIYLYKTLKLTNQPRKVKGMEELQTITPPEEIKKFEEFQQQGYRAVSLFYKDGMTILLEK